MQQTILITGASTGIGKATALYFANRNWNVIATMRDTSKGTGLAQIKNISVLQLDVTNPPEINKIIKTAIQSHQKIDVLFNNAGYALVGAFEAMTEEQVRKQFDTNVFGVMNMTRAILPHFRQNKSGTIITTTSMGGLLTFPMYSVYHATKWALEGFLESIQFELRQFNIKIKNIEPGSIKTEFYKSLKFYTNDDYQKYTDVINKNMGNIENISPGPECVAKIVYEAATDDSNKLRYPAGGNGPLLLFLRRILPFKIFNFALRKQLEKGI